jgi:hypothetical protein
MRLQFIKRGISAPLLEYVPESIEKSKPEEVGFGRRSVSLNIWFKQAAHLIVFHLAVKDRLPSILMVRQFIDVVHNQWDKFEILKLCY